MAPEIQQRVFQQGLASQYRAIAEASVNKVARVGTHDSETGAPSSTTPSRPASEVSDSRSHLP